MSRVIKNNKKILTRPRIIGIVVVFIFLALLYPTIRPSTIDKNKLYKQALAEMSIGDYDKAIKKLDKLVKIDPTYKDAKEKLSESKRRLYDQAVNSAKAGDYEKAEERLVALSDIDPDYKDVEQKLDEVEQQQNESNQNQPSGGDNTSPGDNSGGDNTSPGDNSGGDSAPLKAIPADAKPIDLLPQSLDGYRIIQNGWLSEPVSAGSTYIPNDSAVREEIDRVILTVLKFDLEKSADDAFNEWKKQFSGSNETLQVNNHSAFFGLYNESRPDTYPPMARIMWTRDNWLFYVDVLPGNSPSTSFKQRIGLDVVEKFGY